MPESFISPLDDRCSALENFVENTGPSFVHWNGYRAPPSMFNGHGRSQPTIATDERLKAAIHAPKVHVDADGDGRVTKHRRRKRARAESEGSGEERHRPTPPRKCSSVHYGVRFRPDLHKWVAELRVWEWKDVDKKVWLGTFDTEDKAARGVDLARKLLKCRKKRPFNLPCPELDQYSTTIPSELDLTDIANDAMFKQAVNFIKSEGQKYATRSFTTPGASPLAAPPQLEHPATTPLGYDELELPWNDPDDYEVGLYSDSEVAILPSPRARHPTLALPDAGVEPEVMVLTDVDMADIFHDSFPPVADLDNSSRPTSTPRSSFTVHELHELHEFHFQAAQNEIARGASPPQPGRLDIAPWESPVCHDFDHLPQTWPGSATSANLLPLHSGLQSEIYISPVDDGEITCFEAGNHWLLQEQFQFHMELG